MNKDLEQFSEERLEEIAQHGLNRGIYSDDLKSLARIALSVKQAKPALIFDKPDSLAYRRLIQTFEVGTEFYTTTQPAHTEQDGWKLVPNEPTQEMVDAHISGMQSAGFIRAYRDMLAAAPKPEAQ